MENDPLNGPAKLGGDHPFSPLFWTPVFYVDFMLICQLRWLICAWFALDLRPLGVTLGSLWLPLGSLLVPVGSLWVPLGLLLYILGLESLSFGPSWRHFSSFWIFSMKCAPEPATKLQVNHMQLDPGRVQTNYHAKNTTGACNTTIQLLRILKINICTIFIAYVFFS
jgi:hypothetical protein